MKKVFFVFALLMACVTTAFSQETVRETVYLKNGSIIKGLVIEQVPNESLKIQTADGSIFVYKMEEVEKITKEILPTTARRERTVRVSTKKPVSDIRGYRGFVDMGYIAGLGDYGSDGIEINTSHGYQFNEHFFVGGGMGIHYHGDYDVATVPVFVEGRANFIKGRIAPFASVRVGVSAIVDDDEPGGFYFSPTVGARFAIVRNLALYLSTGYNLQMAEIYFYGSGYGSWYDTKNIGGLTFKFGIEF
ncbi:hypothetical protein M2480_000622 [Parabacteroides sp. PFB2-12]|uniref:hypothetical protein n=1 Tax=unclassified Parabacteroides TaxID=2649774 RepID=UPI0024734F18|nr:MULTISPECIES: hypothetical protein [unclassified Parabacteroides]MDH6341960.1 hypothetical protein [Parabacteroides sp. PM6-13]MDH6389657.1 hypothetical protein [Parabacteroides sp. PFB2-12]